jgi:hypothetical protein
MPAAVRGGLAGEAVERGDADAADSLDRRVHVGDMVEPVRLVDVDPRHGEHAPR